MIKLRTNLQNSEKQIANLVEMQTQNGAHNILPFQLEDMKSQNTAGTWNNNVYTTLGVDFTVNNDGTILVNSSGATGLASFYITTHSAFEPGEYILSGCPAGGDISKYYLDIVDTYWGRYLMDTGSSGTGTIIADRLYHVRIIVETNTVVDNLLFKPMLRIGADIDSTWRPYAMSNRALTEWKEDYIKLYISCTDLNAGSYTTINLPENMLSVSYHISKIEFWVSTLCLVYGNVVYIDLPSNKKCVFYIEHDKLVVYTDEGTTFPDNSQLAVYIARDA